jgi:acetyl esterase
VNKPKKVISRDEPGRLDPEIQQFVNRMSEGWKQYPSLDSVGIEEARRIAEQVRAPFASGGPEMARTSEVFVEAPDGPVRIRIYDPNDAESKPALAYVHGGGWTIFSIDTHDRVMREYAARTGMIVIGVDYSMSPESRFPRAIVEITAIMRWLERSGKEYRIDPTRLALGGDSAGAAMTISACVSLRDEGLPHLVKAMLLNYGAFDPSCSNESHQRFGSGGFMWSPGEMASFWSNYLGESPPTEPLACPIYADVRDLPPAYSAVPDCDVMFEEALAMAERLRCHGVYSHVAIYAGATHSFLEAVSMARISDRAFDEAARWLTDTLG